MSNLTEDAIEQIALQELLALGWQTAFGPDIAPEGARPERAHYEEVILEGRLRAALERLNPHLPAQALDEAMRKVRMVETPALVEQNRIFHRMLTDGVAVSWMGAEGECHGQVWLIDPVNPDRNEWLAVNQFTVSENKRARRPDIVLFVNGLPLVVIELKNPEDERATLHNAFKQLQTYKEELPTLFGYNALLVISDGMSARFGTLTSGWDRFMPWRTITGEDLYREPGNDRQTEGEVKPGLEVLIQGLLQPPCFQDYLLNFITFEEDQTGLLKKAAAYHQYHAVNQALASTLTACGIKGDGAALYAGFAEAEAGDPFRESQEMPMVADAAGPDRYRPGFGSRKAGVVWHTQGSGKSLSMLFYASKVIRHPAMENPTIVVLTDRNDLDNQLFGTFSANRQLLRQTPVQAQSRTHLRELLQVASGGVIFTTIQKFFPEERGRKYSALSERSNIVVIADEAHRSQYDFIDGFARHMRDALPHATFIGFTGTPIETEDKSTRAVFGDYISVYDIQRAVEDGATVPIYYESRLIRVELEEEAQQWLDEEFEAITEAEEDEARKQRLKSKWTRLEALLGAERRLKLLAEDLVEHFERRQEAMRGKGMIVCMSRRICVELYRAITDLRPEWHHDDIDKGKIKVVMTGSASDPPDWQKHIHSKAERDVLARRFKDPEDKLELVIVRDMWLTGFDAPPLHTMYIDKPMSGHNLMQAIARVNRVFRDKPGGLVVDYVGIASSLKKALAVYTSSGGRGQVAIDQQKAVEVMKEKYEVVRGILHGFEYQPYVQTTDDRERMLGIGYALDFLARVEDGKKRFIREVTALSKAFALAVPHPDALAIRDEAGFFQGVKAQLVKLTRSNSTGNSSEDLDTAVRQLVSRAVAGADVVDIFAAAGLNKPDISILSDEFLEEVRNLPLKNLAIETLKKLIEDRIQTRLRKNVVRSRAFSEMLEEAMRKYHNRAIEAAQVIEELIELARQLRAEEKKPEELGLSEDEWAFYEALADNGSAVAVLGDDKLKEIAHVLVEMVRKNVSVDWSKRESAQARLRVMVKRILKKYGYPPDKAPEATELVLEQTKVLCEDWLAV